MITNRKASASFLLPILTKIAENNGTTASDAIRDLLTDLRHVCDHERLDFAYHDRAAHQVYLEEFRDDRECVVIHPRPH